jgi:hypothetical protein
MSPKVPTNQPFALVRATRAASDEALVKSWLRSLNSPHTQRNFEVTARRSLAKLPEGACVPQRSRMSATHSAA